MSDSPILDWYDMRNYQFRIADFIVEKPRCAIWVDMGLGKTVSTLTALEMLLRDGALRRALVVGPKRVARKTWTDEIAAWAHLRGLTAAKAIGTPEQRLRALRTDAQIHLINRENVPWLTSMFYDRRPHPSKPGKWIVKQLRRVPWGSIVLDESTSYQSNDSQRFRNMSYLQRDVERLVELTGEPIPNGYMGLWSQMYLLDQGTRLGGNITTYRKSYFDYDFQRDKYTLKETAEARIQQAVSDITLTLRAEDYYNLPKVLPNKIPVTLTKDEMKKYRQMERQFVLELEGKKITAANAGVVYGKLLQLANGTIYTGEEDRSYVAFHARKLDMLFELLEDIQGPCLIVYTFRPDLYRIVERMQKWAKQHGKKWAKLETEEHERLWNNNELDYLIMHPASGGHGLNLHKSSSENIIWFGLTPNADLHSQMNGRLFGGRRRLGKNGVVHYIMAEGTKDYIVFDALGDKDDVQYALKSAMAKTLQGYK